MIERFTQYIESARKRVPDTVRHFSLDQGPQAWTSHAVHMLPKDVQQWQMVNPFGTLVHISAEEIPDALAEFYGRMVKVSRNMEIARSLAEVGFSHKTSRRGKEHVCSAFATMHERMGDGTAYYQDGVWRTTQRPRARTTQSKLVLKGVSHD